MPINEQMLDQIRIGRGFIAALDQSGGSTPKALANYGIEDGAWTSEPEMFNLVHKMRSRIIQSEAFTGQRVIGAILFEDTMDRTIDGMPTARYMWERKRIVPFLKIDRGLEATEEGVQRLKPMPGLADLLQRATENQIFGTKQRSVIHAADREGIRAIVEQQFDVGQQVLSFGLMPILEPEVTISIEDKCLAENILLEELLQGLESMPEGQQVMLKLSLPSEKDLYLPLVNHPKVLRVVALSGGYSRDEANAILSANSGIVASFSRALSDGLTAQQTETQFDAQLGAAVASIYQASISG